MVHYVILSSPQQCQWIVKVSNAGGGQILAQIKTLGTAKSQNVGVFLTGHLYEGLAFSKEKHFNQGTEGHQLSQPSQPASFISVNSVNYPGRQPQKSQ